MQVLDKGYIRLVDTMGDDLTVVNTARVSFDKQSDELTDQNKRLINYLVKHRHDSCLRHCVMTFEVYAPLMVVRQWYKHAVASTHWDDQSGWNETSRRYVTENDEFYIPTEFFMAPDNKKQGAAGPMDESMQEYWSHRLWEHQQVSSQLYDAAMEDGMAPEQARLFLPAYGLYVRWRWTASLNAVFSFLNLRLDSHAQWEIRQYAAEVEKMVETKYPVTYAAWKEHR